MTAQRDDYFLLADGCYATACISNADRGGPE